MPVRMLLAAALVGLGSTSHAEFQFIGAGESDFNYTFGGFTQSSLPSGGVRLTDPTDDSGGAGKGYGSALDLSSYTDGRFVVDLTTQPGNGSDAFLLELIDGAGNGGKWQLSSAGAGPGTPQTIVSSGTLSEPSSEIGSFASFDPTSVNLFQVIGTFTTPAPFDIAFDSILVSNDVAPPPPYPGFEPDAPWRAEAATRIDAIRKGDLTVQVRDAAGNPVTGAAVDVLQTEHEFGFGSAMQAFRLRDNNPTHNTYKQMAAELFNVGTLENNLKWQAWDGEFGSNFTRTGADAAVTWLEDNGLEPRGHVMVWPGVNNLPTDVENLVNSAPLNAAEQQQLRDRIAGHIADIGGRYAGRIGAWDVINEPRTNNDVMDVLAEGDDAMITWFQQAAAADPNADLYLNEFGILTSGGATNTANQQLLESQLQALIDGGAPIDGVGLQGHFNDASLTGPEQLWQILDRYHDLGLNIQITEFDHGSNDEQLQAAYLRDFFTAVFAHEGVSDLIQWGFWENAHFDPQRALFRSDWSIKPNGQAYVDLVFDEWWTEESLAADASGDADLRGFKGTHEVTVTWAGSEVVALATIDGAGNVLSIDLPVLVGDYNGDGAVDAADYTVWRDSLGQEVASPGLGADGDGSGVIDQGDLNVWRANFGATATSTSEAIPEPSALTLLALAAASLCRRRTR